MRRSRAAIGQDVHDADDDYYDDEFYIQPRVIKRYPRRIYRDYGPDFSACIGGPNAKFCVYD